MDYAGQKLAEKILQTIIIVFGGVGWLYGFYIQDFYMTVKILGAGVLLATMLVMPPWPFMYRRNPLKWAQEPRTPSVEPVATTDKKKK